MIHSKRSGQRSLEKWMNCPKENFEFPGLAYLYRLDQLVVAKKLDKLHNVLEKHDVSYTIYNNEGEKIFIAVQKNHNNQFQIQFFNLYGNEVITMKKSSKCFLTKVFVWAPPDNFVGTVEQSCFSDKCEVKNSEGAVMFFVKKLYSEDTIFSVLLNGEEVGVVMQGWGQFPFDNYVVSFPRDLPVGTKAVMLAACILMMHKWCK